MTLSPPYAVAVRNGRTLVVPTRRFHEDGAAHPLAEVLPYGSVDVQEVAAAIANRLNWHDELVDMVRDLVVLFDPVNKPHRTAAQLAMIAQARVMLKTI